MNKYDKVVIRTRRKIYSSERANESYIKWKVVVSDAKESKKQKPMDESNEMATCVKCYTIGQ